MDKQLDPVKDKLDECGAITEEHAGMNTSLEPYGPSGFRGLFSSPYVAACAAFSAIGGLLFGYDQGVISVTLVMDHFLDRFPEVSDDAPGAGFKKGLMTAMITLGAFIGAINQGWISDWISRKRSLMVAVVVFTIGSTLQTAAINYAMLVVGRFIGGIGIGQLSMVVPLYIAEISPPEIRGALLVFEELSIVIGIVVAFWITYGTKGIPSHWSWQLPFLLQILPGLLLGFGAIFLPYSPRWLASKDREEEALSNLAKLRALPESDSRVQREWMDIIAEARFQASVLRERHPNLTQRTDVVGKIRLELVSWGDCFKSGCRRRTLVGAGLMFFQQFTGINALIYYSPTLFGTMGLDFDMQLIMSGVLNVTQLIGVLSSLWTMDRFGRRGILLWGSFLMFVPHLIIAVLVGRFSDDWPSHTAEGWTSVAFLLFYMLAFGASWGPVPWAMPAEVFPSSLRAKGVAISTCSNWINNFIIGLITPPLVRETGFGAYVFFAVFCLLSFVWVWFSVPETNGKSLEEMDSVFKDRTGVADIAEKDRILAEDEVVLISMTSKTVVSHESVVDDNPSEDLARQTSHVYADTLDNPIWLPRRSTSSGGVGARIHRGLASEKEMTLLGCCRNFPKAIMWSFLLFLTVVMEAYDKSLISGFLAFPSFRRRYGEPRLSEAGSDGRRDYEISPLWQMGLQNAAVGCEIIGLLAHGYISYAIGYRKMMIVALVWMCLALSVRLTDSSQGLSWGVIQTLAATYAAEVVPSVIRAAILSNVNMCWLIGQLMGTGILRALIKNTSDWSYRLPFALQWAWAVPLLFVIYFAPESPWWLIRHERLSEARHSLQRLTSNKHIDIEDTIAIMQHVDSTEKQLGYGGASFLDLFKGCNRRRTEVCCMTWSCQALCGATLTGYAPYFLEQAGFESSKSFTLATGMYGLGILGGMISWVLLSMIGRRRLYLAGLVAALLILTTGGILSIILANHSSLNWVLGSLIILMTFTYNMSIGPACYVIVAEIPSTRLRVKTIALARIVYNFFTIINNIVAPQLLNPTAWDLGGRSCLVYAATSFLCLIWCYFRLPETKKLSYLELDILFDKGAPTAKFKELQDRLANSAYISVSKAERIRNAWHGWLAYS
ncbi:general substrate transporter [Fusarium oxysporum]|nr:general substrate transporter [Fusarium oxysporum]